MAAPVRRRVLATASGALGLLFAVTGTAHVVGVTGTALRLRGALDDRWAVLAAFGVSLVAGSLILAASAVPVWKGSASARLWVAWSGAAGLFLLAITGLVAAAFSIGPPILFASYLVLWAACRRAASGP